VRIFERTPPGQQEPGPVLQQGVDRESEARAIVERARGTRRPTPRWLWIVAAVVTAVLVAAFGIGILFGGTGGTQGSHGPTQTGGGGGRGYGIGLMIGLGAGIPIGYAIAMSRRDRQ
jgi:hypothetical protein